MAKTFCGMGRGAVGLALAVWLLAGGMTMRATQAGPLTHPLAFAAHKSDQSRIMGQITSYDEQGFEYTPRGPKAEAQQVAWSDLVAYDVYALHKRIYQLQPVDGRTWLTLGQTLWGMANGKPLATRALVEAVRLDPSLKDAAAAIREGKEPTLPKTDVKGAWPRLSDAAAQKEINAIKALGEKAKQQFCPGLELYETNRFVFFSDLPPAEARSWQQLLDRMYDRLTEMFGLPRNTNIWKGKAGLFIFQKRDDFHHMADLFGGGKYPDWAVGLCHGFGNGRVIINFYRSPNVTRFAHVLVHESTHGFVFRYRSRHDVPSWVNEGLAEWVACTLVPASSDLVSARVDLGIKFRKNPSLDGMFDAEQIQPPQYPMAMTMTDVMIQSNPHGYVEFFNGLKDGEPWQESLKKHFGIDVDQLLAGYSRALKLNTTVRAK